MMAIANEYVARHRYAKLTARKARLSADLIRGRGVNEAIEILALNSRRASAFYLKVLKSAIANASQNEDVNVNRLYVSDCRADDGPLLQGRLRWRPGPQGRAMPYRKRTSHLTVVLSEREGVEGRSRKADAEASQSESEG